MWHTFGLSAADKVSSRDMSCVGLIKGLVVLQEAVAAVLGICFRLFVDPKNPDSVVNTAATTVRQVVEPCCLLKPLAYWSSLCVNYLHLQ